VTPRTTRSPREVLGLARPGRGLGTFGGVFTPTLLTILGVIMFLRQGWVMGNAGLLGGVLVILLAFLITGITGLSMSSITTNIRIGAGGAYAIVAQSLGLEIGGSLGIPRYVSQALAVTMYVFGFREGWLWIFPDHSPLLVDAVVFLGLYGIAYASLDLAIRVQYLIMAIIGGALLSVAVAAYQGSMVVPLGEVQLWGDFPGAPEHGFPGTDFWVVFAVFFPASTGIMAGANLSGDLRNPRKSIPIGTMSAILVSLVIYLALAYWLARSATPEELASNYTVMMDKAAWGPAVLAGLLGATFSSALASLVGSARILQAMGEHRVLPRSSWLGRVTGKAEPRNAMMVTGGLILASLLLRDLNVVAPLITMFYLITYAMINAVVLIEQSMGLVSFRPLLRIPRWVSAAGLLGSLLAMFVVHPVFSLLAVATVLVFYVVLLRRRLEAPFGDMRSGLFVSLAEWAAKKTADLPSMQERAWKPNVLVPLEDPRDVRGSFLLLHDLTYPRGSVKLMGLRTEHADDRLDARVFALSNAFKDQQVFASWTVVDSPAGYTTGLVAGMQTLRGAFFKPNILFLNLPPDDTREPDFNRIMKEATGEQIGLLLHGPHPRAGLGQRRTVNVWIRDRSPDWSLSMDMGNLDLPILAGYKLLRNWGARMRLITVLGDEGSTEEARQFLEAVIELGRIPRTRVMALAAPFDEYLPQAPQADVSIFGLGGRIDFGFVRRMVDETRSTCLFARDSGRESALA
jgi:solute carrier family 12 sodium/potassium/chloride transporter 2